MELNEAEQTSSRIIERFFIIFATIRFNREKTDTEPKLCYAHHQLIDRAQKNVHRESMDYLGTSQDVVELRAGASVDLTLSQQLTKASTKLTANHSNDQRPDSAVTCFVCGTVGTYQLFSLRVRENPARPSEPYFPFLASHHEPPRGLQPVSPTQSKVQACSMCQQLLTQQW